MAPDISSIDPINKDRLPIILSFLDDARKLIEAGKVRRWEVFKWAFALNLLFASAAAAQVKLTITPLLFMIASLGTSIMAALLINHYDRRLNGARIRNRALKKWLKANILDIDAIMEPTPPIGIRSRDQHEKFFLYSGIFVSLLAVAVAASMV